MHDKAVITQVVYSAIDELNAQLPAGQQVAKTPDCALFGKHAALDSLGLVNLIVTVEGKVAEDLGAAVTLADERAMSRRNSPFRTVETLVDYIEELLSETVDA